MTIYATPLPLSKQPSIPSALPVGAAAAISAQGNNVPCWDSSQALTQFLEAERAGDKTAVEMQVADHALFLTEGDRVRALSRSGLLHQILKLKLVSGDHAGAACFEPAALAIYAHIKRVKK